MPTTLDATTSTGRSTGRSARTHARWSWIAMLLLGAPVVLLRLPAVAALVLGTAAACVMPGAMRDSARLGSFTIKVAVCALGAGIDFGVLMHVGGHGLGLAAGTLALTCLIGAVLTRVFGIEPDTGILVTLGTAICGGSAIAAAAVVLRARAGSIATALGIVFAFNAAALLVFPWLGAHTDLPAERFGEWCALAIHDTSSVIGAAASRGERALEMATVTKLARALWIVPACLGLAYLRRDPLAKHAPASLPVPWFILGFIALAAAFSALPALESFRLPLREIGQRGLALALFLLGGSLDRSTLRSIRLRHLALGLALWLTLGCASFVALSLRV